MKIEEKTIQTETIYIANDGTRFKDENSCQLYEKYAPMTIYNIISPYCIIEEQDIEKFNNNEVPFFAYLIVVDKIPKDKIAYCNLIEKMNNKYLSGIPNLEFSDTPTLFYNDWNSAFSGSSNFNGWKEQGTKKEIEAKIKHYKELLEKFKNRVDN